MIYRKHTLKQRWHTRIISDSQQDSRDDVHDSNGMKLNVRTARFDTETVAVPSDTEGLLPSRQILKGIQYLTVIQILVIREAVTWIYASIV